MVPGSKPSRAKQDSIHVLLSQPHTASANLLKQQGTGGWLLGCHQRGRMGGSSIRLTHECVTGYFCFLNKVKAECGTSWAFRHVYLCMYEHVCMKEETFQEKLSGWLPLTAIHRQIQNTKQQLLQSETWGCPPASAQLFQLPFLLQKH